MRAVVAARHGARATPGHACCCGSLHEAREAAATWRERVQRSERAASSTAVAKANWLDGAQYDNWKKVAMKRKT